MKLFIVSVLLLLTQSALAQSADSFQKRQEFSEFAQSVDSTIRGASAVARTQKERGDVRTLQFLLRDLNKHIAAGNWAQATDVRNKMRAALARGGAVAADGPRRVAEQQERRHQEQLNQQNRQHQEAMRQRDRIHQEDMLQRYQLQYLYRMRNGY